MKVIYLVRDPRGSMNSRWTDVRSWCLNTSDCGNVERHCNDLEKDYLAAKYLHYTYPSNFMYVILLKISYGDWVFNITIKLVIFTLNVFS